MERSKSTIVIVALIIGAALLVLAAWYVFRTPAEVTEHSAQVTVSTRAADGVELFGTLLVPELDDDVDDYPVIIFVHDDGQDRTEWRDADLARYLDVGFGVIVYDRRGYGESTHRAGGNSAGTVEPTGAVEDEVQDVIALASWIGTRDDVRNEVVGIVGSGSGATLAFLAQGKLDRVVAAVALSPIGTDDPRTLAATSLTFRPAQVLFITNDSDDAYARQLFDRTANPREIEQVAGTTHGSAFLRDDDVSRVALDWLLQYVVTPIFIEGS